MHAHECKNFYSQSHYKKIRKHFEPKTNVRMRRLETSHRTLYAVRSYIRVDTYIATYLTMILRPFLASREFFMLVRKKMSLTVLE